MNQLLDPRRRATLGLVLALLAAPALAQDWAGRGRLQGQLKDEAGQPVDGARLTFRKGAAGVDAATPGPEPVLSNAKGRWAIGGLGQGVWSVLIEKPGFMPSEGQLSVNEYGSAPSAVITLKRPSAEATAAAEAQSARGLLEAGNALLAAGKWPQARAEYEKALALLEPPYHPLILRGIAQTYAQEQDYPAAIARLQQALSIADEIETLHLLARVQHQSGQVQAAIETLKQTLAAQPDDVPTLRLISELLIDAGRQAEAQPYLSRLPAGTAIDPVTLLNSGIRMYNEQKLAEAWATFDQVVTANPQLADGYYYRGLTALGLGKLAEGKADLEKVLALAPDHARAAEVREMLKAM
jgi:tetratricopeptide (TPR) repeat protein